MLPKPFYVFISKLVAAIVTANIRGSPGYMCAAEIPGYTCGKCSHMDSLELMVFPRRERWGAFSVLLLCFLVLKQYYLLNIVGTCVYKVYPVKMARIVPL